MSTDPTQPTVTIPAVRFGEKIEIGTFRDEFTWVVKVEPWSLKSGVATTAQDAAEAITLAILTLRGVS